MFDEEEWNDVGSAQVVTPCVPSDSEISKERVAAKVGKKSLLRTLQTLGSAPDWTSGSVPKGSDGDSDEEPTFQPKKKKKKRIKKRKRGSLANGQEEGQGVQEGEVEAPTTNKKQKKDLRPKALQKENHTGYDAAVQKDEEKDQCAENSLEKPLSRQQWRNRIKNKKKCKNKYKDKCHQTPLSSDTKKDLVLKKRESNPDTSTIADTSNAEIQPKKSKKHKEKRCKQTDTLKNPTMQKDKSTTEEVPPMACSTEKDVTDSTASPAALKTELLTSADRSKQKKLQMRNIKLRYMLKSQRAVDSATPSECKEEEEEEEDKEEKMSEEPGLNRSAALRSKMAKRLEAARFRYINELLYTSTSGEAKRMFQRDPEAFHIYHQGFTTQLQHWPQNPLDHVIAFIRQKPASLVVADFGCGDCRIARSVKNKVHSFDLAQTCDLVTVCDMAKVPLQDRSVDIAVFCLALMGTNLTDFLSEANRVLKMGGILKIAEVASRFENIRSFITALSTLGFKLNSKDTENSYFFIFDFSKVSDTPVKAKKMSLTLKPCLYKKR